MLGALIRVVASKVKNIATAVKTAIKDTVSTVAKHTVVKNTVENPNKPNANDFPTVKPLEPVSGKKPESYVPPINPSDVSRETFRKPDKEVSRETMKPIEPIKNVSRETNDYNNNEAFKFLLNNAGDPFLSPYDVSDVSVFFALTKYIWDKPGITLDKRFDAIINYFNGRSLYDIFEYIIKSDEAMEYLEDLEFGDVDYSAYLFSPYAISGFQIFSSQAA